MLRTMHGTIKRNRPNKHLSQDVFFKVSFWRASCCGSFCSFHVSNSGTRATHFGGTRWLTQKMWQCLQATNRCSVATSGPAVGLDRRLGGLEGFPMYPLQNHQSKGYLNQGPGRPGKHWAFRFHVKLRAIRACVTKWGGGRDFLVFPLSQPHERVSSPAEAKSLLTPRTSSHVRISASALGRLRRSICAVTLKTMLEENLRNTPQINMEP